MPGKGVIIAVVIVLAAVAAGFFAYTMFPSGQQPGTDQPTTGSAAQSAPPNSAVDTSSSAAPQGNISISSASLSNGGLTVTVENMGAQPVTINSLMVLTGTGCPLTTSVPARTNQTQTQFTRPSCMEGSVNFVVQSNASLRQFTAPQVNFTRTGNFTFTSRSGNFTRSGTGTGPGGFRGFGGLGGYQLAAGQSVTLTYSGTIGVGVTSGSQYTIAVMGQQARAQTTLLAT